MSKTDEIIYKHIARVQLKLERLIIELENRTKTHDDSKTKEPEHHMWERMDNEPRYQYGTKEYEDKKFRNQFVFDLHYQNNKHHPEHFENGILDMDLIDIIEMLCDWISYKDILSYTEASKSIELQAKRFGLDEQLLTILLNTLRNYFVSLGGLDEKSEYLEKIKEKIK